MLKAFGIAAVTIGAAALVQGASPQAQAAFTVPAAQEWATRAYELAGPDQRAEAQALCRAPGAGGPPRGSGEPQIVKFGPTRVFDDLYYFGSTHVGATVVQTTRGLVLIDSLTTSEAAAEELVGGMKAMLLDPADIRYLILTHGHGDHYGGIPYLRSHYPNFLVIASEDEWEFLKKPSLMGGKPDPSPKAPRGPRDVGYSQTYDLTVGDKVFHLIETPGHTPGTTSLIYNVKIAGVSHEVMQWGGGEPTDTRVSDASFAHFAERAKALHADIRWGSHARGDWMTLQPRVTPGSLEQTGLVAGSTKVGLYIDIAGMCRKAIAIQAAGG